MDHTHHITHYKSLITKITLEDILTQVTVKHDMFTAIRNGIPVKCREPRGTAWFSNNNHTFAYGGKVMKPKPLPPILQTIADQLEKSIKIRYDSVLVNYYPNGSSGMRYHSDPLMDPDDQTRQIWSDDSAVVSLGDTRRFKVRQTDLPKEGEERFYKEYLVQNGDVIHMFNRCQQLFQHTVQTEKRTKDVGPRISLVFKHHL